MLGQRERKAMIAMSSTPLVHELAQQKPDLHGRERMWAHRLVRPRTFETIETHRPAPAELADGDVMLRTQVGAVCGSDLPYFRGAVSPLFDDVAALAPNVPGYPLHEVVGEVVWSRDPDLPVGARAVGWATSTNALAEYVVTKSASLMAVSDEMSSADAVILQPLACVTDAVRALGDLSGLRVAVIGLGPFGLLFCHVAKAFGAATTVGVDPVDRSGVAHSFGVDELVTSTSDRWSRTIKDSDRTDLVIEAVGHQTSTLTDAIRAAAPHGRVFCFGVPDEPVYPFPMQEVFRKSLKISAGIVTERRSALRVAERYLAEHPELRELYVTHTFSSEDVQRAFECAAQPTPKRIKVRIVMPGNEG
jgi:L-iditol 2-dehydrogenase